MPINGPTTDNRNALVDTDFESDAFAHGPLLQPIVKVDTTKSMSGTGSTATPVGVELSADANNAITRGADDGLYVPDGANFNFTADADSGTSQGISEGSTLLFEGFGEVDTTVLFPDTIRIDVPFLGAALGSTYSPFNGLALDITDSGDNVTFSSYTLFQINVSLTRTLRQLIVIQPTVELALGDGGDWTWTLEQDIDGGGFVTIHSASFGPNESDVETAFSFPLAVTQIIAPGASETRTFRQRIVCNTTANSTSTITRATLRVSFTGTKI